MVKEKCDQGDVREEISGKWEDGLSLGGQRGRCWIWRCFRPLCGRAGSGFAGTSLLLFDLFFGGVRLTAGSPALRVRSFRLCRNIAVLLGLIN
jgi:hypothetical protein